MHMKNSHIPEILYFVSKLLLKNSENTSKKVLKQNS